MLLRDVQFLELRQRLLSHIQALGVGHHDFAAGREAGVQQHVPITTCEALC